MRLIKLLLIAAVFPSFLFAQPDFITSLHPPQHGLNIPADAELLVGLQAPLDPASLSDSSIYVWSDITGLHRLTVTLEDDDQTVRIAPRHWRLNDRLPFNAGERVTVTLTTRLRYADGQLFEGFTWHYTVAVRQNFGGHFSPHALFTGGGSTYFNVSDFNGDGWADLIGDDDGVQRKMIVFFNDGTGIMQFSHIADINKPLAEVVDLDRDGDQDIAYLGNRLVFNDGKGNFSIREFPERTVGSVKAHDFNNDGIMDFAIGSVQNDTVFFYCSAAEMPAAMNKVALPAIKPEFYRAGITYDLNNDGRIDLLHNGRGSGSKRGFVRYLDIDSSDSPTPLHYDTQFQVRNFHGNDFDGDSDIDYIMVGGGSGLEIQYMNDGTGALLPEGLQVDSMDTQRLRIAVAGGDFDGDGDIDLAFANSNLVSGFPVVYEPDVCIYSNDGNGKFSLVNRIPLLFDRSISFRLEAVDLDNDGDLDLLGVSSGLFYVVANGSYATGVSRRDSFEPPAQFTLKPNYPNPFNPATTIRYTLPHAGKVSIRIFNLLGEEVRGWQNVTKPSGEHTLLWDGTDARGIEVSSGVYVLQISYRSFESGALPIAQSRKLTLVR